MIRKFLLFLIVLLPVWGYVSGQSFSLLKDIWPGPDGLSVTPPFFPVGNTLYFPGTTSANGQELWRTDGTPDGTFMVKDINPGSSSIYIEKFVMYNGEVYFNALTNDGMQLWKTDGTAAGTVFVADICPTCDDDQVLLGMVCNGRILFEGYTSANGYELWSYDGTSVQMVSELYAGAESGLVRLLDVMDDELYFIGNDGVNGYTLWKSDGTAAGTQMLKVISGVANPDVTPLGIYNGLFYFAAIDTDHGKELWRTDGTPAGTFMVKDINPGKGHSNPFEFVELNGMVFFTANREIYKTDGTEAGTEALLPRPTAPGSRIHTNLVKMGNTIYFCAREPDDGYGYELYKTDGTAAGTVLVKDINPGAADGYPNNIAAIGNTLYFAADDGEHGQELWQSDGTTNGTMMIQELIPGTEGTILGYFSHTDTKIFMLAETPEYGVEIWISDFTITLPLQLLVFEGSVSGKDARLWWKTTDEQQISHIVLERSDDGSRFISAATLPPQNTPGEHVYEYTDRLAPVTEDRSYYYRLKTVDLDGSIQYSHIIRLNWHNENQVLVYPNPLAESNNLIVNSSKRVTRWAVFDARGVLVKEGQAGAVNRFTIPGGDWQPGMYYLHLQMADGDRTVKPVVVQ
jgi:hypothetical protein